MNYQLWQETVDSIFKLTKLSSEIIKHLKISDISTSNVIRNYNMTQTMSNITEPNIFFEERQSSSHQENFTKDIQLGESIPYLKKGDSNVYVDQFLSKIQQPFFDIVPRQSEESKKQSHFQGSAEESSYELSQTGKFNPSAFHNFQKHLTVCLKHSIDIQAQENGLKEYQTLGVKLWKHFKNSSVSTKKILHYLLGQKNQHKITEEGLKQLGLNKIYEANDDKTLREARLYLAQQTLRQIKQGKLQTYISAKKLKDKDKFRKYVTIFVGQLQSGYLRKRLPKDKVAYLIRA